VRLEDHLNRARQAWELDQTNLAIEQILCAIQVSAGGAPSILNARQTIAEALREDAGVYGFRQTYLASIACIIMDFETARHVDLKSQPGLMTAAERDALASKILNHIFEL